MMTKHRNASRSICAWVVLVSAVWVLYCATLTRAQAADTEATPDEAVAEYVASVKKLTALFNRYNEQETERLLWRLKGFGETVLPALSDALAGSDDRERVYLVRAIGAIPGDAATSLLVEVAAQPSFSQSASQAVFRLENRAVNRPLTAAELDAFTARIRDAGIVAAGNAARVLGHCVMVPAEARLTPIIARFESELAVPASVGNITGSYLSPRVFARNQFLLAFGSIGEAAIPLLCQKREAAQGEAATWWLLALGFVGDASVAADLKNMLLTEPDKYLRCEAVRAYARSARQDAVPLLTSLLSDTTLSEYTDCSLQPMYLIRNVARDQLAGLSRQAASQ